jgi:hypothetical protein
MNLEFAIPVYHLKMAKDQSCHFQKFKWHPHLEWLP